MDYLFIIVTLLAGASLVLIYQDLVKFFNTVPTTQLTINGDALNVTDRKDQQRLIEIIDSYNTMIYTSRFLAAWCAALQQGEKLPEDKILSDLEWLSYGVTIAKMKIQEDKNAQDNTGA